MLTGVVKFFHPTKNFGFIIPHEKGPDVFFYATEFEGAVNTLKPMQWVEFSEILDTPRGPRAMHVALCKKRGEHERSADRERSKVIPFGAD